MKKILIIHSKYSKKGGEDIAVENEVELLKTKYDVKVVYFENKIQNITDLLSLITLKNLKSVHKVKEALLQFKPDVVYVHNTWFKASIGIFSLLKDYQGKVFIKLHNFRYLCSSNLLSKNHVMLKDGYCQGCGRFFNKKTPIYKFYKESIIKSFFLYIYGRKYITCLKDEKFQILVLTNFHKEVFKNYISKNAYLMRNYIDGGSDHGTKEKEEYILYAGRVSEEKGVRNLITTYQEIKNPKYNLLIIGGGPEFNKFKKEFSSKNIKFISQLSNSETLKLIKKARCVVTATKLYEGQPTLLCEASLNNVPSIFPDTGGIKEFFPSNYKLAYEQFNYDELKSIFYNLDNEELENIGFDVKNFYIENFSKDHYFEAFESLITT
tara:strand:+ start:294 stop:1433 length:1140 start_codon:yes stop_codon:yes gene_type:complete